MFYEMTIKVTKMDESTKRDKEVLERYICDVEFFSEAEQKGIDLYNGEGDVVAIRRSNVYEIVNESHEENDKLFKAQISSIFINDDGKEKEQKYHVLLWADSVNDANKKMQDYMKAGMSDLVLKGIKETKLLDILE